MNKLLGWVSTSATIFLVYASLVWKSMTALTLLKALTVVGLVTLSVVWPLLILMLFLNFEKTLEAFHQSCTWSNQLLSGLSTLANVATVYLFASVGSPLFTILAIIGSFAAVLSWGARYQLSKEYVKRKKKQEDVQNTADELVKAIQSGQVRPEDLFRRLAER